MIYPIGVRLNKGVTLSDDFDNYKEWLGWMKGAGFDVVDVPELTPEVKQAADAASLAIGSFDVKKVPQLFSKEEAKRVAAAESIRKQIAQAAELGGKVCFMCLVPEDKAMPRRESFAIFKDVFPAIVADAEKLGVKIVLEGFPGPAPYYPTLGCTPETLRAMFEAVPSPAFCINYDPSHLVRLGIDYIRFLREFAGRTGHVHAKDCVIVEESLYLYGRHAAVFDQPIKNSEGPWRYAIPGEGSVDWAGIAFELDKAGYQGAVCIELEDHRYKGSAEAHRRGLSKTLDYLHRYFH